MPALAVRFLVHRGRLGGARPRDLRGENTVAAVAAALRLRPAYVEVDTRNLGDGTLVLRHNPKAVLAAGQPATPLKELTRERFAAANPELFHELSLDALLDVVAQAPAETRLVLDIKDLDGARPVANLRSYVDAIAGRGLEGRVVLISWNVRVLQGLLELNRAQPAERRLRLGLSFVPLPLPAWTFRPLAWLVNRTLSSSFGAVVFYNLADVPAAALGRNGLFPICLDRIANVRRSHGEDTVCCFQRIFAQRWFRRVVGPWIGLTQDLRAPPPAVWLYEYDTVAEIRALTPHFATALAREELVLFSRILDRFDFEAEERPCRRRRSGHGARRSAARRVARPLRRPDRGGRGRRSDGPVRQDLHQVRASPRERRAARRPAAAPRRGDRRGGPARAAQYDRDGPRPRDRHLVPKRGRVPRRRAAAPDRAYLLLGALLLLGPVQQIYANLDKRKAAAIEEVLPRLEAALAEPADPGKANQYVAYIKSVEAVPSALLSLDLLLSPVALLLAQTLIVLWHVAVRGRPAPLVEKLLG